MIERKFIITWFAGPGIFLFRLNLLSKGSLRICGLEEEKKLFISWQIMLLKLYLNTFFVNNVFLHSCTHDRWPFLRAVQSSYQMRSEQINTRASKKSSVSSTLKLNTFCKISLIFDSPSVARAVLQTSLLLIKSVTESWSTKNIFKTPPHLSTKSYLLWYRNKDQ